MKLLNKELCMVCCYFNPCNYMSRFLNFLSFINSIRRYKINLLVVEAYSNKSIYRINNTWDHLISIQTEEVYWMKEQLLNVGIKHLIKEGVENIGWIDCDTTITDGDFEKNILKALETKNLVQIFSQCKKILPKNSHHTTTSICKLATEGGDLLKMLLTRYGDVGYGYAYKSKILRNVKLYDKAIVGTGDWLNLLGGIPIQNQKELYNDRFFKGTTIDFFNSYITWQSQMSKNVINSIGCADNKIVALNHGHEHNRQYVSRETILKKGIYNPNSDFRVEKTIPHLTNRKLKLDIYEYFKSRREDDTLTHESAKLADDYIKNYIFYDSNGNVLDINSVDRYAQKSRMIKAFKYISPIQINKKHQHTHLDKPSHEIIISRHTDSKFLHNKNNLNIKSFRKQNRLLRNDFIVLSEPSSPSHTYIVYIIENYYNLCDKIIFITDKDLKKIPTDDEITDLITETKPKHNPIGLVDKSNFIKYNKNISDWFDNNLSEIKINISNVTNLHITSKKNIQKHNIDFYEKLLELHTSTKIDYREDIFNLILSTILK